MSVFSEPTIVLPGETGRGVKPANGKTFTLRELQGFVGGYIEIVSLESGGCLVINELGKINSMQPNLFASLQACTVICEDDDIVGPALYLPAPWRSWMNELE